MTNLQTLATDHSAAVLELIDSTIRASAVQWEAPPRITAEPNDVAAARGVGDPTGETATDPRRLRVRAAVETAKLAIAEATHAMRKATAELSDATAPYVTEELTPGELAALAA